MKQRYLFFLAITLLIILTGCSKSNSNTDSSSLYTPTSADVTAKATLSELQQGRTLFINNCGKCHAIYSPDSYTPTRWTAIMSMMGPNTTLSPSEIQLVTKYVTRGK
jgi:mono/diheme cytochrome c family protein